MVNTPTSFRFDAATLQEIDALAQLLSDRDFEVLGRRFARMQYSRSETIAVAVAFYLEFLRERQERRSAADLRGGATIPGQTSLLDPEEERPAG